MKLLNVIALAPTVRARATQEEMESSVGERFGLRTVLAVADPVPYDNGRVTIKLPHVLTRCDCGLEAVVPWSALKAGRRLSCADCAHKLYRGTEQ